MKFQNCCEASELPECLSSIRTLWTIKIWQSKFQVPCRGVPVQKYNRWQLTLIWWGIGQHIGRVQPINRYGHLVNHIHCLDNSEFCFLLVAFAAFLEFVSHLKFKYVRPPCAELFMLSSSGDVKSLWLIAKRGGDSPVKIINNHALCMRKPNV